MVKKILLVAALTIISFHGLAAPPEGANPDSPIAKWYKSLSLPNGNNCCSIADCRQVTYRFGKNDYQVLIDNKWVDVPNKVVLHNKENITGSAVACYQFDSGVPEILCFVPNDAT